MSVLSKLTAATGTKVVKFLDEEPMRKGLGKLCTRIEYSPDSKLGQMGIDHVFIRNAGKEGKHVMIYGKNGRGLMSGLTKPESKIEQSVVAQLREYFNARWTLRRFNVNI